MKNFFKLLYIILIAVIFVYLYARFIEPAMLNVHYECIYNELIDEEEITILQFSDLHISEYFNIDDLYKAVEKINRENPDIVVFTGDLFDHYDDYDNKDELFRIWNALDMIDASIGKYAVYGNHDYGGGAENVYNQVMEKGGFNLLKDENILLENYNINIIGLDDSIFGKGNRDFLNDVIDVNHYNIVLSHEPDIVDYLLEYNIDLLLSGHSHGGQVNLPFINSLPVLGEKYVRGMYKFENFRETQLYVNIGLGTSQLPFRFMAVPELSVITLNKVKQ